MSEQHWTETASDEELVRALCDIEEGLSQWEVDRSEEWFTRVCKTGRSLSSGQRSKAIEILKEKG